MTKTMTVKEIADALNVNPETIKKRIRELYPDLMQNGKITVLTELQVTELKLSLQANPHLQQSLQVINTDLEMALQLENVARYFKNKYEDAQKQITDLKPKAIGYDTFISNKSSQKIGDVAKIFGIKPNTFHQMLRDAKIMQENYVPYAQYQRLFKTVETPTPAGFNKFTSYLLPEGVAFIARKFNLIELPEDKIAQIN
jgi:phage antirepressor YoqD-like protein